MRKRKKYDDDATEEYFTQEGGDSFDESDDFDVQDDFNDKTQIKNLDDDYGYNGMIDEGERTILTGPKKKQDIFGLLVVKKGRRKGDRFDLTKEDVIIGRSSSCCDIMIDDEDISRIHCRIRKEIGTNEFNFFDCGSTNGTMINGEVVHHKILKSHDIISMGESVELIFIQV